MRFHWPDVFPAGIQAIAFGEQQFLTDLRIKSRLFKVLEVPVAALMKFGDFGNDTEKEIEQDLRMKDPVQNNPDKDRDKDKDSIEVKINLKKFGGGFLGHGSVKRQRNCLLYAQLRRRPDFSTKLFRRETGRPSFILKLIYFIWGKAETRTFP